MNESMNPITGGCLCGSVRYKSSGDSTHPTLCHCSTCRRASGAQLLGWVTFPKREFRFTADPPTEFRSSTPVVRTFCSKCGTPLTYWNENSPDEIDVTIGSLDSPDNFPPADHTWMSDAVVWDQPADGLPQYRSKRIK